MASSTQIPYSEQRACKDGKMWVNEEFYFSVLKMRDELIEDQRLEIIHLKQKVNRLKQGKR